MYAARLRRASLDLRPVSQQVIARDYAATPAQRAQNAEALTWLRDVVRARRQTVER